MGFPYPSLSWGDGRPQRDLYRGFIGIIIGNYVRIMENGNYYSILGLCWGYYLGL